MFKAAEWYVKERAPNSSVYSFVDMSGGLMRLVIGLIIGGTVSAQTGGLSVELDNRLMDYYDFDDHSIPPRMILREALALSVQLDKTVNNLHRVIKGGMVTHCSINLIRTGNFIKRLERLALRRYRRFVLRLRRRLIVPATLAGLFCLRLLLFTLVESIAEMFAEPKPDMGVDLT